MFNLTTDIIRKNCNFDFYFNKTDITPTVLDGGYEIILANWPNDKHIICNINNDIPVKIPSHPYVLVNRSILCNCAIEANSHHLLKSLKVCDNKLAKLTMYFTINLAFSNYLELIPNMTDQLPIKKGKTDFEQPLPIYLNNLHFDNSLSNRPGKLKEFVCKITCRVQMTKKFLICKKRCTRYTFSPYENFFLNKIVSIFTFTSSIISTITITLVIYLFCKHKHIRTIVASLLLYKAKEVEGSKPMKLEDSECGTLAYIGIALTLLSMAVVILVHYRKSKFCRGHRFSNIVKIVLFISDVQHYIPIRLCKTSGSLHLFNVIGTLTSEGVRLNKNYLWDTLEIKWDKIKLSFNSNKIELPKLVMIKIQDKIRVRRMTE